MADRLWASLLLLASVFVPATAFGQVVRENESETVEPPAAGVGEAKFKPDLDAVRDRIVAETNHFREGENRGPVKANAELTKAAQGFAEYMAAHDVFSHTADGREPWDRIKAAGYAYCLALENIAYEYNSEGFTTDDLAKQFVEGWKESPPHRKNMLDPDATEIGVGVAYSTKTGRYYAVQDYGRPLSEKLSFKIVNTTDSELKYALNGKDFTLPPGYTITHERCRPPELRFEWPAGADVAPAAKETRRPTAGAKYVVRKDGAGAFTVDGR